MKLAFYFGSLTMSAGMMKNSTTMSSVGVPVAIPMSDPSMELQLNRLVQPGMKPGFLNSTVCTVYSVYSVYSMHIVQPGMKPGFLTYKSSFKNKKVG